MTLAELVEEATRRVCERVEGADALEVRDAIAHAVQVYLGSHCPEAEEEQTTC